ncbi:hypothetical protein ACFOQM_06270 [Paenibacillus sp. GCM10012307]|uniref:Resolvase/invertase-type recombinase catalytic domain-containing protein n=1 Tax=Paenibacillus roseus TaxID=2798579 RepID=A0A934J3E8_9BACL|nr:hypothetical protein [Paenibacillus roseus]MBJ6360904.1 hypothetical protein [Paenibacillus roseus]
MTTRTIVYARFSSDNQSNESNNTPVKVRASLGKQNLAKQTAGRGLDALIPLKTIIR